MRSLSLLAVATLMVCSLQSKANEPASPAATPAAPVSAPATTTDKATTASNTQAPTPAEGAAPASAKPAVTAAATPRAEEEEYKPPLGYKKERRDGVDVYCRRDVESGSRFTHKTCYTRADLEFVIERNQGAKDELIRATRVCSNPAACSSP